MLKDYVVFDTETTGLSPERDYIIEIGALKVKDGKVCERFSQFINPHMELSPFVKELTGITQEQVDGAPELYPVIEAFLDFSKDQVLIGHNLRFDYRFVKAAAAKYGLTFERQGLDTLKIARVIHKDMSSRKLEMLCEHYGIVNDRAHRAYHDALATAKLYQCMAHFHEAENPALFVPESLEERRKNPRPATKKQKEYLAALYQHHGLKNPPDPDRLTMSEASKLIDKTILIHGMIQGKGKGR